MLNLNAIDLFDNVCNFELIGESVINELMSVGDYNFEECYFIEEFDFEGCDVKLVRGVGYRGEGCYEGLIYKNGVKYYVDVMNGEIEKLNS